MVVAAGFAAICAPDPFPPLLLHRNGKLKLVQTKITSNFSNLKTPEETTQQEITTHGVCPHCNKNITSCFNLTHGPYLEFIAKREFLLGIKKDEYITSDHVYKCVYNTFVTIVESEKYSTDPSSVNIDELPNYEYPKCFEDSHLSNITGIILNERLF